jgi:hypothetical protein
MLSEATNKLLFPLRWVMDPRVSPLRHLRPAQRFQVMCLLGIMWTLVFCMASGFWFFYGELIAIHLLLFVGVLITGLSFYGASKHGGDQEAAHVRK